MLFRSLPASATVAGDFYRVIITPNDGQADGAPFTTASVPVALDSDADGLNDDWEIANFGSLGAQTGTGDPDGDGFDNTQEFQAGTDPNDAASALVISSVTPVGDDVVITFASVAGKSYRVEWSSDLPGSWNMVADITAGSGSTQVPDLGGALLPGRYYRVRLLTAGN